MIVNVINSIIRRRKDQKPTSVFGDPKGFYLTYTDDPSTTVDIMYEQPTNENLGSDIYYREVGGSDFLTLSGASEKYPNTGAGTDVPERRIYRFQLNSLSPDTQYEFRFLDNENAKIHKFKTYDNDDIKLVTTGDYQTNSEVRFYDIGTAIAKENPDVILMGGDWVSDDGLASRGLRWVNFWKWWADVMIDEDGNSIPVLPLIGNHEVLGGYNATFPDDAPYFYAFFPTMKDNHYRSFDFSNHLSVICLDSEHTYPVIDGEDDQTQYLENELQAKNNAGFKHVLPAWHAGPYPSFRNWTSGIALRTRQHWVPLCEAAGVKLITNYHEHCYKRTPAILNEQENENGIIYIGDGPWWGGPRSPFNPATTWYIDEAYGTFYKEGLDGPHPDDGEPAQVEERGLHFYMIEFGETKRTIKSVNQFNEVFHEFEQDV